MFKQDIKSEVRH